MKIVNFTANNLVVGTLCIKESGMAELRVFRVGNNNLFEYKDEVLAIIVLAKAHMNSISESMPDWSLKMVF